VDTTEPQPPPKPGTEDVLPRALQHLDWAKGYKAYELLRHDLVVRAEKGLVKYHVRLQANNGRSAMVDAFQEAQDAVMYLGQKALESPGDTNVEHLRWMAEDLALGIAAYLIKQQENQGG
jgi:hypothetical protein